MSGTPHGGLRLTLLRHGHAAAASGSDDHDRPLDARGRAEVAAVAGELLRIAGRPDLCLASDALRTRQTATLLCGSTGFDGLAPILEPALYLATPEEILGAVRAAAGAIGHVLVVGHNPGLSELGTWLRAEAGLEPAAVGLGTAGFTSVALDADAWARLRAAPAR